MPGGDRTGPAGMGPMTGRGFGVCAGNADPGYANPGYGRGFGYGRGLGYGRGFCGGRGFGGGQGGRWRAPFPGYGYGGPYEAAYAADMPTTPRETEALKAQASYLEKMLEKITNRIAELEKAGKE
ncbi:MAG: DUF5320 domain-containing protein [Desulfobacterales bacterium]|nr:DUF5320 domain-containing protein [Desulfobacterales bacterium]MDD4073006.1 DUF5320 domain-containing protein [Desulfobacterales bacterium]MDD4391508.1 DUF5320 domain-containing protein [Desulfobacterales bacterium]